MMPGYLSPALAGYRRMRRLKNRLLNLVDPPVLVLLYHRVAVLPSDPHGLAVSPENFRAQMHHLKENHRVVRFEDDWSSLKKPAVAVTFDDGYADNLLNALPVLEEVGVPATFFVSTGTLGTREEFWWDELERIVLGEGNPRSRFSLHDPEFARNWPASTRQERLVMHDELHPLMRKIGPQRREDWLEQLRAWAGVDRAGRVSNRPLTPDEMRTLGASPWATIGAHGVTHTALSTLSEKEQWEEIISSKARIEDLLGSGIRIFSYPYGNKTHFNGTTIRLCRQAGFWKVAANFPGQAHRWTGHYKIPRHVVRDWSAETFSARLEDFWS